MNEKDIKKLVDRFFDGETTTDDEQRLYDYFASADVSPYLMHLRQMFADLQAMQRQPHLMQSTGTSHAKRWVIWRRTAWAAAILATAGILAATYFSVASRNECEMMVYGKRVTGQENVMGEVRSTMTTACEGMPDVNAQLKEIFNHE